MLAAKKLLRWLYLGRLTLASVFFAATLPAWPFADPAMVRPASLLWFASLAVTVASAWHTHLRGRDPGRNFLYAQVIYDVLLVTAVVHLTGGADSELAPLYILVIAAGALLLPLPGGVLIGALASILYFADLVWLHPPPVPSTVFLQIGLFSVIALATGALGDRLRRTGTALGEVESELRQLRLDTSDILGAVDTGVASVDGEGHLVYMNPAGESLLSLRFADWFGRPVLEELDRRAPGLGAAIRRTAETGVPIRRYETRAAPFAAGPSPDARPREAGGGEPVPTRILGVRTTILERDDALPWITAVFQDITDGKRVEALNRRAERLEAIAELAGSLAHEIKNPLASIRSAVEQLANGRLRRDDESVLQRLVLTESDRLSRLLTDFLDFSRVEVRHRQLVDLSALVDRAVRLVSEHPDGQGGGTINAVTPQRPIEVEGDEDLLHRAVFNLILNAAQHAGPGGAVRVELRRCRPAELPAGLQLASPVRIAVADTGPGIPEDATRRVFDPFFTTRAGGTGLGLAVVHRAVQAHGGAILVDGRSAHGGAEFMVYLPARVRAVR